MTTPNVNQTIRDAWEASRIANTLEATVPKPSNAAIRAAHIEAANRHSSAAASLAGGPRASEASTFTKTAASHTLRSKSY